MTLNDKDKEKTVAENFSCHKNNMKTPTTYAKSVSEVRMVKP